MKIYCDRDLFKIFKYLLIIITRKTMKILLYRTEYREKSFFENYNLNIYSCIILKVAKIRKQNILINI